MRIAAAAVALGLLLPAAASADTLGLTLNPSAPSIDDSVTVTVAATAAAPSSLWVFVNPVTLPCQATAAAEIQNSADPLTNYAGFSIGAGPTTFNLYWYPEDALPYVLCGYIAQTGATVPTALAVQPVVVSGGPPQVTPPVFPGPSIPVEPDDPTAAVDVPRAPSNPVERLFSRLHSHTFGTDPLPISVGASHKPANGDSGGAAVSGDNRKTRLAAFHSSASNLVAGDSNGVKDVFVWQRPRGRVGLVLNHLGGALKRVSVSSSGKQGNGDSTNPSLDGSIQSVPHCVAFQSTATNLAAGDRDRASDIYVRDLRSRKTYLVSRGVGPAATNPSLDGRCQQVVFQAGGAVFQGSAHGGGAHRISGGSQPDYSLDGSAIVWTKGGSVWIRRRGVTNKVGPGSNPRVSDEESGIWGIVFDSKRRLTKRDHDSKVDVYTRVLKRRGGPSRTDLISTASGGAAYNGGITAYGANRGIIVFAIHEGQGSGLWYRNNHTGNIDDLAFTTRGALQEIATSARANFVAFTAAQAVSTLDRSSHTDVFFKHLVDGESY